ncbi:pyridoxal phosphate-dependent transferase [Lineolata rhizophorae]|uniref:Pyridoxal phosphate-dependent transferase n=1 Tax=Lineolata rhizophorae TaxID=578093 RepID=A0A6A6NPW7_9PEZI|nr:pyridoxal phosphate-dependent transferase [Lineolata rhizophorae]
MTSKFEYSRSEHDTPLEYDQYISQMREKEFPMLNGKTYLDHAGTTLYSKSLIDNFSADLIANLYGNPHSNSTPSVVSGRRVDNVRARTLRFFNADPDHFDLVFVANATAAIKVVTDAFRDHQNRTSEKFWYGYHRDAHTSLVGVREISKNLHRCFKSDSEVESWIENSCPTGDGRVGLFAYPGQSNMTGRRLPLSWCQRIHSDSKRKRVYTLLDAAALATTAQLDFSDPAASPDFTALSFYKIFGFPDLGALIVRKSSGSILRQRRYFGGGTVDMVIALDDTWHAKRESLHEALEDGTLPFHSIIALDIAMATHQQLFGSMGRISSHTAFLIRTLHAAAVEMRHPNGAPLLAVYNDTAAVYGNAATQGATLAFNVLRTNGSVIGYGEVERAADTQGVFVRSGGLCNPGGVATHLAFSAKEMRAAYAAGHRCSQPHEIMMGRPTGVVRASLGAMSTLQDVTRLIEFLREEFTGITSSAECASEGSVTEVEQKVIGLTVKVEEAVKSQVLSKAKRWTRKMGRLVGPRNTTVVV